MAQDFPHHTPTSIRAPFANYCHGIEIPPGARLLVCSGQLGIDLEDKVPEGSEAQTDLIFENIAAVLEAAKMNLTNLVRINAYVSSREYLPGYMKARDRYVSTPPPASTLMIVTGFAREDFVVEIEVIAAKVD